MDTSKIYRMELRREVLELDEKRKELAAAVIEAESKIADTTAYDEELAREDATFSRESDELLRAHMARCAAIRAAHGAPAQQVNDALDEHDNAAAYEEVAYYDDDGQAVRCVLTGLPILEGDETIEDSEGRKALAAAIAGWPLFESEETDDDADDEDAS